MQRKSDKFNKVTFTILCRVYTRRQINQDRMILGDFSVNSKQIFFKFCKGIFFYSNPNSPENFIKLYSVFQKLDYLTMN